MPGQSDHERCQCSVLRESNVRVKAKKRKKVMKRKDAQLFSHLELWRFDGADHGPILGPKD